MSDKPPRKPPQAELLSDFERGELRTWATKHGMAIRNATDEQLVLPVWRKSQSEKRTLQIRDSRSSANLPL
jgi:hypothetical protein